MSSITWILPIGSIDDAVAFPGEASSLASMFIYPLTIRPQQAAMPRNISFSGSLPRKSTLRVAATTGKVSFSQPFTCCSEISRYLGLHRCPNLPCTYCSIILMLPAPLHRSVRRCMLVHISLHFQSSCGGDWCLSRRLVQRCLGLRGDVQSWVM